MMKKTEKAAQPLAGYETLVCVTGGIACYKVADLASKLVQAGCGVHVALTDAAREFIQPLTFQSLTGRQVYTSLWQSTQYYDMQHISLTEAADLVVVAPATADIIGKMAGGIADDLVSTIIMASHGSCPTLLAPAMNLRMWQAPAVQANIQRLRQWGVQMVGPDEGRLACGTVGPGRMAEPADILKAIQAIILKKPPKRAR